MPEVNDHDLLVEIKTKLERVITDVQDLKDDLVTDVANLKKEKLDKEEAQHVISAIKLTTNDHETRVRSLERWRWIVVGGFSLALTLLTLFVTYHPAH